METPNSQFIKVQLPEKKSPTRCKIKLRQLATYIPSKSYKYLYISVNKDPLNQRTLPLLKPEYRNNISPEELLTDYDKITYGKDAQHSFRDVCHKNKTLLEFNSFRETRGVEDTMRKIQERRLAFKRKYRMIFDTQSQSFTPKIAHVRKEIAQIKLPNGLNEEKKYYRKMNHILETVP